MSVVSKMVAKILKDRTMMKTEGVLSCCAVVGIRGFPDTLSLESYRLKDSEVVDVIKSVVSQRLEYAVDDNESIAIVTLNTFQMNAAKALTELGFVNTGWAHRPEDNDPSDGEWTKVAVFVKNLVGTVEVKI